jgi:2,3-bisphosphoglycerate-independent phosphoglycerate mutase
VHVRIETDRQAGDIAGTKLKKFHYALEETIVKEFELVEHHFGYSGAQHADVYIIAKPKKEKIVQGPPVKMEEHVRAFKKLHKDTFEKKNTLYARVKPRYSCTAFCKEFAKKDIVKQMGVTHLEVL